jgi:hypothetical protein
MKPEANEVLQQAKSNLTAPDFKTMSIMESTKWCVERGYDKPADIASMTGKKANVIYTALWKIRNPKRVKVLQRRARKAKAKKLVLAVSKAKPTTMKTKKPVIKNGFYADGMETPFLDALNRQGILPKSRNQEAQVWQRNDIELEKEVHRLRILVAHYEALLFGKGGK